MYFWLVLAALIHAIWGQGAPSDFDSACVQMLTTPSDEVALFDSQAYADLYPTKWLYRRADGNTNANTRVSSKKCVCVCVCVSILHVSFISLLAYAISSTHKLHTHMHTHHSCSHTIWSNELFNVTGILNEVNEPIFFIVLG